MDYCRLLRTLFATLVVCGGWCCTSALDAQEASGVRRMLETQQFHEMAQQRPGVLVPMYVYPANIHTNPEFNRLMELKRKYSTVPFWVIVNPASGPGPQVDANYTKAIDRLIGAGCVVLGYVSTSYAKRPARDVQQDVVRWQEMYPRVHGIFFDEMVYEDRDEGVAYQTALNQFAHGRGLWPTVGNPGTDTPGRYFAARAADVIVVHEADQWPAIERIKGDYFGGYSDYPPFTRAVLVHSMKPFQKEKLDAVRPYARWFYVTQDLYRPNDPAAPNPWDTLSQHLEPLCQALAE